MTPNEIERLADMVQCLFCEILDEPTTRPTDLDEIMHALSVVKRRGSELKMSLRRSRSELDCRFTLGNVADLTGSHCPIEEPCQRCSLERRISTLEKERDPSLAEYDDSEPQTRWRILEWTGSQQVADDVSALFRYSGEPRPEVAKFLTKLAQLNDDLAHDRPPSWP